MRDQPRKRDINTVQLALTKMSLFRAGHTEATMDTSTRILYCKRLYLTVD